MTDAPRIIALFQTADERMRAYGRMITQAQTQIRAHLQDNAALPQSLYGALKQPDDLPYLNKNLSHLDRASASNTTHLNAFRANLVAPSTPREILAASNLVFDWSANLERRMQPVIHEQHQHLDSLPPPFEHWRPVLAEWRAVFQYLSDDPRSDAQLADTLALLQSGQNPWATTR